MIVIFGVKSRPTVRCCTDLLVYMYADGMKLLLKYYNNMNSSKPNVVQVNIFFIVYKHKRKEKKNRITNNH